MVTPTESRVHRRPPRGAARGAAAAAACCLLLSGWAAGSARPGGGARPQGQGEGDAPLLSVGRPVEREMKGGEAHAYRVSVGAGQFARVVVEQKGIDVVVAVTGAGGETVIEVDNNLTGTRGPEEVLLVAEAADTYRVEVRSLEKAAAPGRYEVRVAELRAATETDRTRVAAERVYVEGQRLQDKRTNESRGKAVPLYTEALRLTRAAGDRRAEVMTLANMGTIYNLLGERRRALEYLDQAISIAREISDRQLEATTLSIIGQVYYALGESQ